MLYFFFKERLTSSDIEFDDEPIGSGSFGEVYRVTLKRPFKGRTEAAAKTNMRKLNKKEIHILRITQHPNILEFLDYIPGRHPIIVTELAKESLRAYLDKEKGRVSAELQAKWILESAKAIQYLHNGIPDENGICKPLIHRDLKAANCLLFGDDLVLKLCDFGIAREIDRTKGKGIKSKFVMFRINNK